MCNLVKKIIIFILKDTLADQAEYLIITKTPKWRLYVNLSVPFKFSNLSLPSPPLPYFYYCRIERNEKKNKQLIFYHQARPTQDVVLHILPTSLRF